MESSFKTLLSFSTNPNNFHQKPLKLMEARRRSVWCSVFVELLNTMYIHGNICENFVNFHCNPWSIPLRVVNVAAARHTKGCLIWHVSGGGGVATMDHLVKCWCVFPQLSPTSWTDWEPVEFVRTLPGLQEQFNKIFNFWEEKHHGNQTSYFVALKKLLTRKQSVFSEVSHDALPTALLSQHSAGVSHCIEWTGCRTLACLSPRVSRPACILKHLATLSLFSTTESCGSYWDSMETFQTHPRLKEDTKPIQREKKKQTRT